MAPRNDLEKMILYKHVILSYEGLLQPGQTIKLRGTLFQLEFTLLSFRQQILAEPRCPKSRGTEPHWHHRKSKETHCLISYRGSLALVISFAGRK